MVLTSENNIILQVLICYLLFSTVLWRALAFSGVLWRALA
jgi:hypothetical protein